eukprot:GEMP01035843.1.p1 GENE.GEMP01035843.1~~GEMP01035843.1.p1  ORF type:complete len:467 (+),score=64.32 GEMP01035843.1:135-1535(+)
MTTFNLTSLRTVETDADGDISRGKEPSREPPEGSVTSPILSPVLRRLIDLPLQTTHADSERHEDEDEPQYTKHKGFLRILEEQKEPTLFRVITYFPVSRYNVNGVLVSTPGRERPGPLLLLFMFHARLYERLILLQQHNIDPESFFAPIDVQQGHLGIREIVDLTRDLAEKQHLMAGHIHKGFLAAIKNPPDKLEDRWKCKLNLDEFVVFLIILAEVSFSSPKAECHSTKQRMTRLAVHLNLHRGSHEMRLMLQIAFRDVYAPRIDEYTDFAEVATQLALSRTPNHFVKPAWVKKAVLEAPENIALFRKYEIDGRVNPWEEYPLPALDMGTVTVHKKVSFRIELRNISSQLIDFHISHHIPWLEVRIAKECRMRVVPGFSVVCAVEATPEIEMKYSGSISIATWSSRLDDAPIYEIPLQMHLHTNLNWRLPSSPRWPVAPMSSPRPTKDDMSHSRKFASKCIAVDL